MIKNKKTVAILILLTFALSILAGCSTEKKKFPEKDLVGVIMWGAGGATDVVARTITPMAEKHLGKTVVLQNKTGATGAVATQFVYDQKPDGYNLLYGAENPQLYKVLEISKLDYDDFEPVIILGRGVAVIVVPPDSPYKTVQELYDAAKANPGKLKMGSTGPGGLPYVISALIKTVSGLSFNLIPYDGEGPAMTAMLGGHVDFSAVGLTAAREMIRAGKVKPLAVVANEPVAGIEDVVPISQVYPEYKTYLPYGPFYGIWVKKETPKEVVSVLVDAYKKAFDEQKFQDFIKDFGAVPMGTSGQEAKDYLNKWRAISSWLLYDAGGAKKSPEEFGIKRIQ